MAKYIFVGGGVMSGIGKGVATASIGKILQSKGYKVTALKIDPYINVDAGTMNPIEHGEVFVTKDGVECDQDVGNYERFLDIELTTDNYLTTGRVYKAVINRERNLEYDGKCVEVVPHIPEEVISKIKKAAKKDKADFVLIEIGGTVGEYQNSLFLEAARIMKLKHPKDVLCILLTYLPVPKIIGEMKTKPTQQAVKWLNMAGIQPNLIIARSLYELDETRKKKISTFCNVLKEDVISAPDVKRIYNIPVNFEKDDIGNRILKKFGLKTKRNKDMKEWRKLFGKDFKKKVKIGIVGKYFKTGDFVLMDTYISVIEAIKHACWSLGKKPEIEWIYAQDYEKNPKLLKKLKNYDGIIVPGGFGTRGIEGKIKAIKYCREKKIPFFGLCLGMQLAVVEFARNCAGFKKANSTEINSSCKEPVIDVMPEQKALIKEKRYGGTMRLGEYLCKVNPKTISSKAYPKEFLYERHRHRYELNNDFRDKLKEKGLVIAGVNPEKDLVEIIEIKNHPFFVGVQFHPEFKSRPLKPHPLFKKFISSCIKKRSHS
jgi:CTP synthase